MTKFFKNWMDGSIFMLSAFKRTGKDSFYNQYGIKSNKKIDRYSWFVYSNKNNSFEKNNTFINKLNSVNFHRLSFSDQLKKNIEKEFEGLKITDFNKDSHILIDDLPEETISKLNSQDLLNFKVRDIIKLKADEKKKINENYWCNIVLQDLIKYQKKYNINNFMITDFRFPYEYKTFNENSSLEIFTIKLFRDFIDIPNVNDLSERSLDTFPFDFILVDQRGSLQWLQQNTEIQYFTNYKELTQIF